MRVWINTQVQLMLMQKVSNDQKKYSVSRAKALNARIKHVTITAEEMGTVAWCSISGGYPERE
jgi:hypothetical protein